LYENLCDSDSYAYHHQQLKLLQSKRGGQWVLKAPFHQLGLDGILREYPDAIIVQTHRHPETFVASGCSFSELLRKSGSDYVDKSVVGRDWMDMLEVYTRTFEEARSRHELNCPGQFIDVYHDEFVDDPWPVIESIYKASGKALSEQGRGDMQLWLDNNPKGKHGMHEYHLQDYGISTADVAALFGDYIERYALEGKKQ
jgi:hypothetical protein